MIENGLNDSIFEPYQSYSAVERLRETYPNDLERNSSYKQRIKSIMIETAKKEVDLLSSIDAELIRLGLSPQQEVADPSSFLEFVLSKKTMLLDQFDNFADRNKFKVSEDYTLFVNESKEGEDPFYTVVGGDKVALCRFLTLRGIDIIHTDEEVLKELLEGKTIETFSELTNTMYQGRNEVSKIAREELDTYAKDLKKDFSLIIDNIELGESENIDLVKLKEIFDLYKNIPSRHMSDSYSIAPEFERLVNVKRKLTKEKVSELNDFYENNEELIFEVIGEKYFLNIQDKHEDVESAYMEMFGYTDAELWERRIRNWKNVNKYIIEEISKRGYLEVDDFRQLHVLSTAGVLPIFFRGLRNDKSDWYSANHYKENVEIKTGGSSVSTADVSELKESLEDLASKANRVIRPGFPPYLVNASLGELFSEYVSIHPHPDGNGTNAVFFIEAVKVLRGNYLPPDTYEKPYVSRVITALNKDPLALLIAFTHLSIDSVRYKIRGK